MSKLLHETYNLESKSAQEQPALADIQTCTIQADYRPQIDYEFDTLMPQQLDIHAHQKREKIRKALGLSEGVLLSHTALLSQLNETSTQHRTDILRSLFTYLYMKIENAEKMEDVINALRSFKFTDVAERLVYLHRIAEEEEEEEHIVIQSLQNFAMFMVRERLPEPRIGINLDGLVQAVWKLPDYGTLVMNFLESGDIAFTVLYSQQAPRNRRRKISGELPPYLVMQHINDFVLELTAI